MSNLLDSHAARHSPSALVIDFLRPADVLCVTDFHAAHASHGAELDMWVQVWLCLTPCDTSNLMSQQSVSVWLPLWELSF